MDWFLAYSYLCFYSAYLLMAQLCAVIYIRSSPYWAYATIAGVFVIFQVLLNHWNYGVKRTFPNFSFHLFPVMAVLSFNPWVMSWLFGKRWSEHRKTSQHTANVMIQEAENNFGKDVINKVRHDVASERARDARGDSRQGTADTGAPGPSDTSFTHVADEASDKAQQLNDLILTALPDATAERRQHLVLGMLIEELTVARLVAIASRDLVVLDAALKENNMRLQVMSGERLALVDSIASIAARQGSQDTMRGRSSYRAQGVGLGNLLSDEDTKLVEQCVEVQTMRCRHM